VGKSGTQAVKKPYSSPELVVYGTVEDLTRTVANTGAMDGNIGSTHKTA
jgi:hypothetical protein